MQQLDKKRERGDNIRRREGGKERNRESKMKLLLLFCFFKFCFFGKTLLKRAHLIHKEIGNGNTKANSKYNKN